MNIPHTYLELLEKKGIPAKRQAMEVAFDRNNKGDVSKRRETERTEEFERTQMNEEDIVSEPAEFVEPVREPKKLSIIDRRASSNLDRELIVIRFVNWVNYLYTPKHLLCLVLKSRWFLIWKK